MGDTREKERNRERREGNKKRETTVGMMKISVWIGRGIRVRCATQGAQENADIVQAREGVRSYGAEIT